MSFKILKRLDGEKHIVEHEDTELCVRVHAPTDSLVGTTTRAELSFTEVLFSRILPTDTPSDHGLFPEGPNIRLVGSVHNRIDTDEVAIYDVYVQKGPEFACFDSTEVGEWRVGDGVEAVVCGVTLYPT